MDLRWNTEIEHPFRISLLRRTFPTRLTNLAIALSCHDNHMQSVAPSPAIRKVSETSVGVPIGEALLTNAALDQASVIIRPGSGRILIRLTEVDLGLGRPDILMIAASKSGLLARANRGLRLANLTEAKILVSAHEQSRSQYSAGHVASVIRRLRRVGWLDEYNRMPELPRLVTKSVLLEAKMRDWRTGIQQLARTTWVADRSALLVPKYLERLIPNIALTHNRLGLVVQNDAGQLQWRLHGRSHRPSRLADVWLTELAIRKLLSDSDDQIRSSVANFETAR